MQTTLIELQPVKQVFDQLGVVLFGQLLQFGGGGAEPGAPHQMGNERQVSSCHALILRQASLAIGAKYITVWGVETRVWS